MSLAEGCLADRQCRAGSCFPSSLGLKEGMAISLGEDLNSERLLGLAQAGDREALGRLLEQYRQYLLLLARLQVASQARPSYRG